MVSYHIVIPAAAIPSLLSLNIKNESPSPSILGLEPPFYIFIPSLSDSQASPLPYAIVLQPLESNNIPKDTHVKNNQKQISKVKKYTISAPPLGATFTGTHFCSNHGHQLSLIHHFPINTTSLCFNVFTPQS